MFNLIPQNQGIVEESTRQPLRAADGGVALTRPCVFKPGGQRAVAESRAYGRGHRPFGAPDVLLGLVSAPPIAEVASASALGLGTNRLRPAAAPQPVWARGSGAGRNRGSRRVLPMLGIPLLLAFAEMTI